MAYDPDKPIQYRKVNMTNVKRKSGPRPKDPEANAAKKAMALERRELHRLPMEIVEPENVAIRELMELASRDEWAQAIAAATMTADGSPLNGVILALGDEAHTPLTLAMMCRKAGVTYKTLVQWMRGYKLDHGLVMAALRLPKVIDDTYKDAESRMVLCEKCGGTGSDLETEEGCLMCEASGRVRQVGDKDARHLVFKTEKLIDQSGPATAMQFNFGDSAGLENVAGLMGRIVGPKDKKDA